MVVKRAWPCSSRFVPVGAPIGRSGDFSTVGDSFFLAQLFSASEGCRFSKTSAIGLSATCSLGFLTMRTPVFCFDDREVTAQEQGECDRVKRPVGQRRFDGDAPVASEIALTPWHISTRRTRRGRGAAAILRGRRETRGERSSCR